MGFTYEEVAERNLIPADVLETVPETCPVCGSDIEFTFSLKQIYCKNNKCALKVAARLESMAKAMKADGWGESACLKVCQAYKLITPYQIFAIGERGLPCPDIPAFDKKLASICDPEKRKVRLWEVVRYAGIPSIETIAFKIFDGFDSMEQAYEQIEKYQAPFIAERIGTSNGVMAIHIYEALMEHKEELMYGEQKFDVYVPTGEQVIMAITGKAYGYSSKGEYVKTINDKFKGKVNVVLMNSVSARVNVLIADGDTSSNKFKTACKLKEKGTDILITDSASYIKMLEEKYNM